MFTSIIYHVLYDAWAMGMINLVDESDPWQIKNNVLRYLIIWDFYNL